MTPAELERIRDLWTAVRDCHAERFTIGEPTNRERLQAWCAVNLGTLIAALETARHELANVLQAAQTFALCLSCGPTNRCDSDGCCATCGADLVLVVDGKPHGAPTEAMDVIDRMVTARAALTAERDQLRSERDAAVLELDRLRGGTVRMVQRDTAESIASWLEREAQVDRNDGLGWARTDAYAKRIRNGAWRKAGA